MSLKTPLLFARWADVYTGFCIWSWWFVGPMFGWHVVLAMAVPAVAWLWRNYEPRYYDDFDERSRRPAPDEPPP